MNFWKMHLRRGRGTLPARRSCCLKQAQQLPSKFSSRKKTMNAPKARSHGYSHLWGRIRTLQKIMDLIMEGVEPEPRSLAAYLGIDVAEVNNRLKRLRRRALQIEIAEDGHEKSA